MTYAAAASVLADWINENGGEDASVDFIAAWIADGNSIRQLCTDHALTWGVLAAWIRQVPARDARYKQAMLDRGVFRKERLLDDWWKTADETPDTAPTHGDVHKAREAIAKAEGVFSDKLNVQHSGEVQVDIRRFTPAPNDKPAE